MKNTPVHGNAINIVASIENFILWIALFISPVAWDAAIEGISVVAKAILFKEIC